MVIYKINNLFNKHDKGDQKVKTSFTKRCNQGAKRIGAVRYQRIGSVAITKHHPLLVLLVYVVLRKYLSRIASTNPKLFVFTLPAIIGLAMPLLELPRPSPEINALDGYNI